jgi:hypothetical protein
MALTYAQSATLMRDPTYLGLVTVAVATYGNAILQEPATTPAHNARVQWAVRALQSPQQIAQQLQADCVLGAQTQAAGMNTSTPPGSAVSDSGIQSDLQAVVDLLIG